MKLLSIMKKIITHLKANWIKYGFETAAIFIGIVAAVTMDNLNDLRKDRRDEIQYLANLKVDLENQLEIIVSQKEFEATMKSTCQDILATIHSPPYDVDRLNQLGTTLGRKSFVVRSAVFEDLKSSGNLDILSNADLRNALLEFYEDVTYAETVFANNNRVIHILGDQFIEKGFADFGHSKELMTAAGFSFSIDVEPFRNAEKIILSQLNNDLVRLNLHNRLIFRGRLASLHNHILLDLAEKNRLLISRLEDQLE